MSSKLSRCHPSRHKTLTYQALVATNYVETRTLSKHNSALPNNREVSRRRHSLPMTPLPDVQQLVAVLRRLVNRRWSPRTDATTRCREPPSETIQPPLSMTCRRVIGQSRWTWNCVAQPPLVRTLPLTPRTVLTCSSYRPFGSTPLQIRSVRAN